MMFPLTVALLIIRL